MNALQKNDHHSIQLFSLDQKSSLKCYIQVDPRSQAIMAETNSPYYRNNLKELL